MKTDEEIIKEAFKLKYKYKFSDEWMLDIVRITKEEYANQDKWISTKHPPSISGHIIICTDENLIDFGYYKINSKFSAWGIESNSITHWQPLPNPPKQ